MRLELTLLVLPSHVQFQHISLPKLRGTPMSTQSLNVHHLITYRPCGRFKQNKEIQKLPLSSKYEVVEILRTIKVKGGIVTERYTALI